MQKPDAAKNTRRIPRLTMQIPARILGKDARQENLNEITRLQDFSAFGAAFNLRQQVSKGQLLNIISPIPQKLRCYDYFDTNYNIWSLVRRVESLADNIFAVGVAFIGKSPPVSYVHNPHTRYEVVKQDVSQFWDITEVKEETLFEDASGKDKTDAENRKSSRFQIPVNVTIENYDANRNLIASENTITENISIHGACVFSTLKLPVGSFVRLVSAGYDVSILAVVHESRIGHDDFPRLHLEFIDRNFPLEIG
jgi:hypothetical protein